MKNCCSTDAIGARWVTGSKRRTGGAVGRWPIWPCAPLPLPGFVGVLAGFLTGLTGGLVGGLTGAEFSPARGPRTGFSVVLGGAFFGGLLWPGSGRGFGFGFGAALCGLATDLATFLPCGLGVGFGPSCLPPFLAVAAMLRCRRMVLRVGLTFCAGQRKHYCRMRSMTVHGARTETLFVRLRADAKGRGGGRLTLPLRIPGSFVCWPRQWRM